MHHMAIVSELPFTLKVIKDFPVKTEYNASAFYDEENDIWTDNKATIEIEENENISLLFWAQDPSARLYLEAMDIIPNGDINLRTDENGYLYHLPSKEEFVLFKYGSGNDALCVDVFKIVVQIGEKKYYGTFQVDPKPISIHEWTVMKDDLEREMVGLAQDILRRNIGLGFNKPGNIPPKVLYDFMVIHKYAKQILTSLIDILENPRYEIRTEYREVPDNFQHDLDAETVKRYVRRAGAEATLRVPEKVFFYDIQENRLLKMMIKLFDDRLENFLDILLSMNDNPAVDNSYENNTRKESIRASINNFTEVAIKLRKMTSILQTSDWYRGVSEVEDAYIPHSFILDSRYNSIYQVYLKLKKNDFTVELDPLFSYTWKRSSFLYEMWSYFKVCHLLMHKYELVSTDWFGEFTEKLLFPFLKQGTTSVFGNDNVKIEVIFDHPLPEKEKETSLEHPLYMAKQHNARGHNRPDIVMNVYDRVDGWYIGSLILECKYRKIGSFWNTDPARSSLGQLEAYFNNARSNYLYDEYGVMYEMHPVKKVFVLTPDEKGDGCQSLDFNVVAITFKPTDDNIFSNHLLKELDENISNMVTLSEKLKRQMK